MVKQVRTLGFVEAYAIGLGTMIAAGIFSLSGLAVSEIGSSAVIAFALAALIGGTTAAVYSEFASVYSESGGGYLFTSRTFENDYLVYVEGAMLFVGYSATTAFYLATAGEWIHEFIYPAPAWLSGAVIAILLGTLNARGTEESGTFQVVVTGAKVLVLLIFIGGAFMFKPPGESVSTFVGSFVWSLPGIAKIASLAFITFFGFSAIAASAGEIIRPRETVPKSIAASMVTVFVLYTLVIIAMVNSPVPAEVVAEQGETAMGMVAESFLGEYGMLLIVAGAIFSMVSASNASILAASRIGYLMGREGRAFRRFQFIHRDYGTPIWAIAACTTTIIGLIVIFMRLFPAEGHGQALMGIHLGLPALTGFANVNLLIPLSVVNAALIYSRRKLADYGDAPFKVPLVPLVPIIGIVANLGLIISLPVNGIITGFVGIVTFLAIYLAYGRDLPSVDEVAQNVTDDEPPVEDGGEPAPEADDEPTTRRVLVPVAREEDIAKQVALAQALEAGRAERTELQVIYIDEVPEQTPSDAVDTEDTEAEVARLQESLDRIALGDGITASVEGFVAPDIARAILQVARDEATDLIVMGHPNQHRQVVETVQHKTPCDVVYAFGTDADLDVSTVTLGAGGGPNHDGLLPVVDNLGKRGSDIHIVRVDPEFDGTPEEVEHTVNGLPNTKSYELHNVSQTSVAKGLVDTAKETGGVLFVGASRDHLFKRYLLGSTPDRVVELADEAGVPVVIFRSRASVTGTLEELVFNAARAIRTLTP